MDVSPTAIVHVLVAEMHVSKRHRTARARVDPAAEVAGGGIRVLKCVGEGRSGGATHHASRADASCSGCEGRGWKMASPRRSLRAPSDPDRLQRRDCPDCAGTGRHLRSAAFVVAVAS